MKVYVVVKPSFYSELPEDIVGVYSSRESAEKARDGETNPLPIEIVETELDGKGSAQ